MRVDAVAGNIAETFGRNEKSALRQNEQLADRLRDGGFAAAVRTGENIDGMIFVKNQIVGDNLFCIFHIHGELQIVEAFRRHGGFTLRFRLRFAEHTAFFHQTVY